MIYPLCLTPPPRLAGMQFELRGNRGNRFVDYSLRILHASHYSLARPAWNCRAGCSVAGVCPGVKGSLWWGLFRFIGQYADSFVEFSKDFVQSWIGLLHNESSKITGLALLYLGSLHDIIVAAAIGAEPADEETAA